MSRVESIDAFAVRFRVSAPIHVSIHSKPMLSRSLKFKSDPCSIERARLVCRFDSKNSWRRTIGDARRSLNSIAKVHRNTVGTCIGVPSIDRRFPRYVTTQ